MHKVRLELEVSQSNSYKNNINIGQQQDLTVMIYAIEKFNP